METKKKKFVKPDAEVIDFANEDIITLSLGTGDPGYGDENWDPEVPPQD